MVFLSVQKNLHLFNALAKTFQQLAYPFDALGKTFKWFAYLFKKKASSSLS